MARKEYSVELELNPDSKIVSKLILTILVSLSSHPHTIIRHWKMS